MSRPSVSIFTPTGRHEALFTLQHANALRQTVQDFEWLILDDSPATSGFFSGPGDRRVRYELRAGPRPTIGAKRNLLIERAMPDLVIHLDDDDFHAAHYLATMAASPAAGADTAIFSARLSAGQFSNLYSSLRRWDCSGISKAGGRATPARSLAAARKVKINHSGPALS